MHVFHVRMKEKIKLNKLLQMKPVKTNLLVNF